MSREVKVGKRTALMEGLPGACPRRPSSAGAEAARSRRAEATSLVGLQSMVEFEYIVS